MKLLADESVDGPIVARLRADGFDVASIAEEQPGLSDELVLQRAFSKGIVLITSDKDFGELVYRQRLPHAGVLLLRLAGLDETARCDLVSQALLSEGPKLTGSFSVLTSDALRIRRAPIL